MLAQPTQPLIPADGTKIDPENDSVMRELSSYKEVPTNKEAIIAVQKANRKAAELPDLPSRMNPISAVLTYELLVLDEQQTTISHRVSQLVKSPICAC